MKKKIMNTVRFITVMVVIFTLLAFTGCSDIKTDDDYRIVRSFTICSDDFASDADYQAFHEMIDGCKTLDEIMDIYTSMTGIDPVVECYEH